MELPKVTIVHIPKTGGNSVLHALERTYPAPSRAPFIMGATRPEPETLGRYSLVAGHFGYAYAKRLDGRMITMLREPVSRVLSFFRFWKSFPEGSREHAAVDGLNLREYLESGHPSVTTEVRNTQAWQIAHDNLLASRRDLGEMSDERLLDLAKARLDEFALVGVTEDMGGFADGAARLGIPIGPIGVHNATRSPSLEADQETLALIRRLVAVDLALYDHVRAAA